MTTRAMQRKQADFDAKREDNAILQELFDEVDETWRDVSNRKLGEVHWAPEISVRVDDRNYTRDIATLAVDVEKLGSFTRNVADLGTFYSISSLSPLSSFQSRLLTNISTLQVTNTTPVNSRIASGQSIPFARARPSQPTSSSPSVALFLAASSSIPIRKARTEIPFMSSPSMATPPS